MSKIRVIVVDDHSIVRLGLITLINDQPDMEVVGEAETTTEAVHLVEQTRPDVVLMDIRIPGEGGIEATRQIKQMYPDSKVVILTSYADDELVLNAILAGAVGYVLKQVDIYELLNAIHAAAQGDALIDTHITSRLLSRLRNAERKADEDAFHPLSSRELEVLVEIARGKTNAEIAQALKLSEKTVSNYTGTILEKLQLSRRIDLAIYAYQHHLFEKMGE